ncbi:MAG: SRPBCC family protein [Flavobacteriales bacterium]|nr:SRPBCC family protein [Flavobacteriales bacterium]
MGARSTETGQVTNTTDREIVTTRIIEAQRELVWKAFTDPKALAQWYGPNGFKLTTKVFEFEEGGDWIFVMHSPDGRDYPNWVQFRTITRPARIMHDHGADEGEVMFRAEITFDDLGDRTRVTLRSVFSTKEALEVVVREHGAVEGAKQTLARLDEYLKQIRNNG